MLEQCICRLAVTGPTIAMQCHQSSGMHELCKRDQALREHLNAHNDNLTSLLKCLTEHSSFGIKGDATFHGQHSEQAP